MCFSVALFYNYFLCGKLAFLYGESKSSKKKFQNFLINLLHLLTFVLRRVKGVSKKGKKFLYIISPKYLIIM
jgi:hypothetical protein